jgi:Bacterial Ig domain/Right handed beta helix region
MIRHTLVVCLLSSCVCWSQVTLHPSDNVPKIVNSKPPGTTFVFTPGIYRLAQAITPKDNDSFVGQTACAPPKTSCSAVLSGSIEIGSLAKADSGNYAVTGQTQHGPKAIPKQCDPGWTGCIYPEDLFFDGKPYRHLDSETMPSIGSGEWWFDYANHVIYFHDDPSGHTVETSVVYTAFNGPANNVTLRYLTVQEFADMYPAAAVGVGHGPNSLSEGTNWTIDHCEVKLNHGAGVRIGYRIHILNNYIHDNGQLGVGGGLGARNNPVTESTNSEILIADNVINHNDYAHFNPGFGSGGFKSGGTSGITLRNNVIENNEGSGIHFDADSQNELVDGNLIANNSDADGLVQEIGEGTSIFRNNLVLHNGAQLNSDGWSYQISIRASTGVDVYCNVMEVPTAGNGIGAWGVGASPRGSDEYPPFSYHVSTGNYVHHNTVIFDGTNGEAGFRQNDIAHQPNFFADNRVPDFNTYHVPDLSTPHFVYDNNNSHMNRLQSFSGHQRSRAEVHGSIDTNYASGFPRVVITSPTDQSSVSGPVAVAASASDQSGIRKVEFYVDWKLESTTTDPPYNFNWSSSAPGAHTVAAMAYSNAGVRSCYAVTLSSQ